MPKAMTRNFGDSPMFSLRRHRCSVCREVFTRIGKRKRGPQNVEDEYICSEKCKETQKDAIGEGYNRSRGHRVTVAMQTRSHWK